MSNFTDNYEYVSETKYFWTDKNMMIGFKI